MRIVVAAMLAAVSIGAVRADVRPDPWITAQAKSALAKARGVPSRSIQLTTFQGMVVLQGDVRTPAERSRAEAAVLAVPGVTEVRNLIDVAPPAPPARRPARAAKPSRAPSIPPTTVAVDATPIVPRDESADRDQAIRQAVMDALRDVDESASANIRVEVRDGAVHLTGTVPTWQGNADRMHAVRSVPGVRSILNGVQVASLSS